MATITFVLEVRDNANNGVRKTGLTLTWAHFKRLSDGVDLSQPAISEIANGLYKFNYDPEVEATGQIDAGVSLLFDSDRYVSVLCSRDSSRMLNADVAFSALPGAIADMTLAGHTNPGTFGQAWQFARAGGIWRRGINGADLLVYDVDGTTLLATLPITRNGSGPATEVGL